RVHTAIVLASDLHPLFLFTTGKSKYVGCPVRAQLSRLHRGTENCYVVLCRNGRALAVPAVVVLLRVRRQAQCCPNQPDEEHNYCCFPMHMNFSFRSDPYCRTQSKQVEI